MSFKFTAWLSLTIVFYAIALNNAAEDDFDDFDDTFNMLRREYGFNPRRYKQSSGNEFHEYFRKTFNRLHNHGTTTIDLNTTSEKKNNTLISPNTIDLVLKMKAAFEDPELVSKLFEFKPIILRFLHHVLNMNHKQESPNTRTMISSPLLKNLRDAKETLEDPLLFRKLKQLKLPFLRFITKQLNEEDSKSKELLASLRQIKMILEDPLFDDQIKELQPIVLHFLRNLIQFNVKMRALHPSTSNTKNPEKSDSSNEEEEEEEEEEGDEPVELPSLPVVIEKRFSRPHIKSMGRLVKKETLPPTLPLPRIQRRKIQQAERDDMYRSNRNYF